MPFINYPLPLNLSTGPFFAAQGSLVTVTPGTNANVTVEYTLSKQSAVINNQAEWIAWPSGVVIAPASNIVETEMYVRATSATAASVLRIDIPPSIALPPDLVSAWSNVLYLTV